MAFYTDVQTAFNNEIANVTRLPTFTQENERYRPDLATNWCRGTLLRREPGPGSIGKNTQQEYGGLFQVDIFVPVGEGTSKANEYADALLEHFTRGTVINNGSTNVTIQRAWAETAVGDDKWYQLPVFVRWYSFKTL